MALSFDYVYSKKSEYSEYERDRNVIELIVYFDQSQVQPGDSFTLDIIKSRRNKDEVVATTTYTFAGAASSDNLSFSFDMTLIRDSTDSSIRIMRRGYYLARVTDVGDDSNTLDSDDFKVSLISVDRMKNQWLAGIPLQSVDLVTVSRQPEVVTGVTVTDVSMRHPAAQYPLTFNIVGGKKWLSWAGGKSIEINTSHPLFPMREYFLPGEIGVAGLKVIVDPSSLPSTEVVEELLIDAVKLNDESVMRLVDGAADLIENTDMQFYLEPTLCVTEIDPTQIADTLQMDENSDYDRITTCVSYYGVTPGHWADIQFPFQYLLRIDYLMGAIANNRVISASTEWVEKNYASGFAQLVPLQMEMAFNYLALMWAPSLWGIRDLPNFWHYRALAGLREVPGDLLELLARRSAVSILSIAGQAYKGGFAAQSVSRDGVSESVSYTSSAMYGVYSAYINDHNNWIGEHLPQLRNRYRGIIMRVV